MALKASVQKESRKQSLPKSDFRSSRSEMFFKIGVLRNFAIFTGKHLCWSNNNNALPLHGGEISQLEQL